MNIKEYIDIRDIFVFFGIGLTAYGAFLIYQPSGFIVIGLPLFYLGVTKGARK